MSVSISFRTVDLSHLNYLSTVKITTWNIRHGGGSRTEAITDQSDQGIMGIFTTDAEVHSIIRIIDRINANAEVA